MRASEVWICEPGQVAVRPGESQTPASGEVGVRTRVCGISPGTELLAFRGALPESGEDAEIDPHAGHNQYPMRTGYCLVGKVDAVGEDVDRSWIGQRVFAFHPHASRATVPADSIIPLPDSVSDERATFIPNLETAIGLVHDARPMLGERVVVLGQGIVGLLVTRLLSRYPLELLAVADPVPERRERGLTMGADVAVDPAARRDMSKLEDRLRLEDRPGADLVLELSGNPAGLNDAIALAGFGGRIVAGSWYGNKPAGIDLGGRFHRNRISLISSQVSTISPDLTGRWTKQRRMGRVLRLLPELQLEELITHRVPLEQAGRAFELVDKNPAESLQVVLAANEDDTDGSS